MIDTQPDVNGYPATHVLAGVIWTIWYEWVFYASLMATAYFARGKAHVLLVCGVLALCLAGKVVLGIDAMGFSALFLNGMAVASLLHVNFKLRMSRNLSSTLALACLTITFATSSCGYGTFTARRIVIWRAHDNVCASVGEH